MKDSELTELLISYIVKNQQTLIGNPVTPATLAKAVGGSACRIGVVMPELKRRLKILRLISQYEPKQLFTLYPEPL